MLALFPNQPLHAGSDPRLTRPTTAVAPEFGRAFVEACLRNTPEAASHLREATGEFVQRLKADGLPPERVVVAIKAVLVRYGGFSHAPSYDNEHDTPQDETRTMAYRCVFRWYLDAYYGTVDAARCCLSA